MVWWPRAAIVSIRSERTRCGDPLVAELGVRKCAFFTQIHGLAPRQALPPLLAGRPARASHFFLRPCYRRREATASTALKHTAPRPACLAAYDTAGTRPRPRSPGPLKTAATRARACPHPHPVVTRFGFWFWFGSVSQSTKKKIGSATFYFLFFWFWFFCKNRCGICLALH